MQKLLVQECMAATWMDLEIIILSEVRQRQMLHDIAYIESKK